MFVTVRDLNTGRIYGNASSREEVSQFMSDFGGIDKVQVTFSFCMPLKAEVVRSNGPDMVVLTSDGKTRSFQRRIGSDQDPEKLSVQCEQKGEKVPAKTIILHIPMDSIAHVTDRGVVWVVPGKSAWAYMTIRPRAIRDLKAPAFEIIEAARKEVKEKIVDRFLN